MRTATEINHVLEWFETGLRAALVESRKTLQGAGLIAIILLYSLVGWSQNPAYSDSIVGGVTCVLESKFSTKGSVLNDYTPTDGTGTISCPEPPGGRTGEADANAHVGTFLNAYAHVTTTVDQDGETTSASALAAALDTVELIAPPGFTGRSVKVGIRQGYQYDANDTDALVRFCWHFNSNGACHSANRVKSTGGYSTTISVSKDNTGRFLLQATLNAGVVGAGAGSTVVLLGTPQFILPHGWTYSWASGE